MRINDDQTLKHLPSIKHRNYPRITLFDSDDANSKPSLIKLMVRKLSVNRRSHCDLKSISIMQRSCPRILKTIQVSRNSLILVLARSFHSPKATSAKKKVWKLYFLVGVNRNQFESIFIATINHEGFKLLIDFV